MRPTNRSLKRSRMPKSPDASRGSSFAILYTLYYNVLMSITLTVRTDGDLHEALRRRAQMQGKTVSEVVRDILAEALSERSLASRAGHLKGSLTLPPPKEAWRRKLKERNWRS
jgi:plasmid stability protein